MPISAASSSSRRAGAAVLSIALVLLLAHCGEGTMPPAGAPPVERIAADFDGFTDVIVVTAVDRLPLRSAVLIDPEGQRTDAYSLDVRSSPVIPPSPAEETFMTTPGVPRRVATLGAMAATALIRLPDATRYAKTWRDWKIELKLGDPGSGGRDVTLAAPAPRS